MLMTKQCSNKKETVLNTERKQGRGEHILITHKKEKEHKKRCHQEWRHTDTGLSALFPSGVTVFNNEHSHHCQNNNLETAVSEGYLEVTKQKK